MVVAKPVLLPLVTAVLLTFILTPPVVFLQSRGLGRLPAVLLVVALVFLMLAGMSEKHSPEESAPENTSRRVPVCAVCRRQDDELILQMFKAALDPAKFELSVLSTELLLSEIIEQIAAAAPVAVVIGSARLSPRSRFMCKRLRKSLPEQTIIVAAWDSQPTSELIAKRWQAAGANQVTRSFAELVNRLVEVRARGSDLPCSQEHRLQTSTA
jgi:hypothetical protein